jgi:putative ABC transport system substrate-binding protein
VRRRYFISLLGGAATAWPLAARAQQAMPVIGFLYSQSADPFAHRLRAFRQGLKETGYVEGENVAIEYRWAENQPDRLPSLVAELIHQQVSVIAALTTPSAIAAKVATATIPIVFTTIGDPVQIGLVASLSRPGGNLTGVTILNVEIVPKMLELLHQVVPTATTTAVLVNPTNPNAETLSTSLQVAARTLGLELNVLRASTERDIDKPFATLIPLRVGGLTRNRLRTGGKPSARLSPPIWRRCASATLHPPRRHLQPPADRLRRARRHLQVQRTIAPTAVRATSS